MTHQHLCHDVDGPCEPEATEAHRPGSYLRAASRALLLTTCVASLTGTARAWQQAPPYTQAWQVTLSNADDGSRRAFGEAANADGQIVGTTEDTAVARAESESDPIPFGSHATDASTDFSRRFTLPQGFIYKLTLNVSLKGDLETLDTEDTAAVNAIAVIRPLAAPAFLSVSENDEPALGTTLSAFLGSEQVDTSYTKSTGFTVLPGTYEVTGILFTRTASLCGDTGVDALANFFNDSSFGFRVTATFEKRPVAAAQGPLPPWVLVAMAVGLLGLAALTLR